MQNWLRRARTGQHGYMMVAVLLISAVIMVMVLGLLSEATTEQRLARRSVDWEGAWYGALAGVEECVKYIQWGTEAAPHGGDWLLYQSGSIPGCDVTGSVGSATYDVSANVPGSGRAEITSVGTAGRASRQLHAVVTFGTGGEFDPDFMAGGLIDFEGGSKGLIRGNFAAVHSLTIPSQLQLCGEIRAAVLDLPDPPNWLDESYCINNDELDPDLEYPDFDIAWFATESNVTGMGWNWVELTTETMPSCPSNAPCGDPTTPTVYYSPGHLKGGSNGGAACGSGSPGSGSDAHFVGQVYFVANGNICLGRDITHDEYDIDNPDADGGGVVYFFTEQNLYAAPGGNELVGVYLVADPGTCPDIAGVDHVDCYRSTSPYYDPASGYEDEDRGNVQTPGDIVIYGSVFAWRWNNSGTIYLYNRPDASEYIPGASTTGLTALWESSP